MDETLQSFSTESLPKKLSCFTGCFRSSNKKLSKDMKAAASSSKNNKTTSLTFLSSFCVNKSAVETNHVKAAVSEKPSRSTKEFPQSPKLNKKITQQKNNKQAAGTNKTYLPAPAPGDTNSKVHNHTKKNSEIGKDNFIEKSSKFHQSILLVKGGSRQNPKKEKKRSRSSSFGPLQEENNIVPTKTTTRVLSHSISLPPPNPKKEKAIRGENDVDNGGENQGKLDPIVGMSIMLGTLAIMLIWGKLCAIICTCAWLYMVPRLRIKESIRLSSSSLDFESVEYKKKVVLEGLLQRDRRRLVSN